MHCEDVKCQSWHLCGAGSPSGCDVHEFRGDAGCTCGRSDETTGWLGPRLALAGGRGNVFCYEDGLDIIISGHESIVRMSSVSCGICVEPDLLPVVMSTDTVELLAVPVVALTRSLVGGPPVIA